MAAWRASASQYGTVYRELAWVLAASALAVFLSSLVSLFEVSIDESADLAPKDDFDICRVGEFFGGGN